jgi:hypothetical protein
MPVRRQRQQLPAFTPLLEEIELAGWTSAGDSTSAHFHDWLLLDEGRVLVMVGRADAAAASNSADAAFALQAAWSAVRAHALHVSDAGKLLSLTSRTIWPSLGASGSASMAVALVDGIGGQASVAMAGDCDVWRIRAAACEPLARRQPALGAAAGFAYHTNSFTLSLRERLLLVADPSAASGNRDAAAAVSSIANADCETHRRMTAADVVATARESIQAAGDSNCPAPVSLAAIRRR